jgi:PmbA protein
MKTRKELEDIVRLGIKLLKKEKGLLEGLIYLSNNRVTIGRLVFTTHIPSSGLEEPKTSEEMGVAVEIWFEKNGKKLLGSGYEAGELSLEAIGRALVKAKRDAVEDREFYGFLKSADVRSRKKTVKKTELNKIELSKEEAALLAKISWDTIRGAIDGLEGYRKNHRKSLEKLSFILNGDNFLMHEKMAMGTTDGILESDETHSVSSLMTAMLEEQNAKGSAWDAKLLTDDFSGYEIGKRATLAAVNSIGGVRVRGGEQVVVFGHQAVTELFGNLLLLHANLSMVDFGASLFVGKYGQQVASPLLTLYDDATLAGGAGSKAITCEGYPTGKTLLIKDGNLVGYLSDSRTTNKILNKGKESAKLFGVDPHEIKHAISPKNGFRFIDNTIRTATTRVGIHASNLVVDSSKAVSIGKLLKNVKNGIFIGRLWYTYPVGGYASGIITGTAVADCYTIRNGKLKDPILPNSLRLEDNIGKMIKNIIGIADNKIPTVLWSSDAIVYAPWVAMEDVKFVEIGKNK